MDTCFTDSMNSLDTMILFDKLPSDISFPYNIMWFDWSEVMSVNCTFGRLLHADSIVFVHSYPYMHVMLFYTRVISLQISLWKK